MKKSRKIILCASAVACASTVTAGAAISVLSANNLSKTIDEMKAVMPKYLGLDEDDIARYAFNDNVISFNGRYYENSKAAVKDNIIQGELATPYDKKILINDEKFIGTAESRELNGGSLSQLKVNEALAEKKLFRADEGTVPAEQRIIPLYENGRNNSESTPLNERFTTNLLEAQRRSISNYTSGLKYTDGFGGKFDSESAAIESNKTLIAQKTTYGQGYYKVDDRSVQLNSDGSYQQVNINPLNNYDKDRLRRLAVDNLGVNNTEFDLELYNKAKLEESTTPADGGSKAYTLRASRENGDNLEDYIVPTDSLYKLSSDKVALNAAGLFSNFIFDKLKSSIKYDVTMNPTFMRPFDFKLFREQGITWIGAFGVHGMMYPDDLEHGKDNSYADKNYGPIKGMTRKVNRSNEFGAYFRLTVNGKQEETIPNVSYSDLLDMIDTFTNREKFRQTFSIDTKQEYTWYYKGKTNFGEKATLPGGKWGFGKDITFDYEGGDKNGNWNDLGRAMDYVNNRKVVSRPHGGGGYEIPMNSEGNTAPSYLPIDINSYDGRHGYMFRQNRSFVQPDAIYGYPVETTDFAWYDSSYTLTDEKTGKVHNSGLAVNLKITPKISASKQTIAGWATDFIKELKKYPEIYNDFVDNDATKLTSQVDAIFDNLANYLYSNLNGQQRIQKFDQRYGADYYKPIGTMTSDNRVENSASFLWDFIKTQDFLPRFRNEYLNRTTFAIKKNIKKNNTYLILKYRGVPLFAIDNAALDSLGILDEMVRTNPNGGTYFDLDAARKALQATIVSPSSSRALLEAMKNISNKIELVNTINSDKRVIKRFVLPGRNIDGNPSNDTHLVKLAPAKDENHPFRSIVIDPKFVGQSGGSNNNAVEGLELLLSKNDPVDLLRKNSGIYLIANQYNKQLEQFYEYEKQQGHTVTIDSKDANDLVKNEDDILILYNKAALDSSNKSDKERISDSLVGAYYGQTFQRQGTFNISLNNEMISSKLFTYEEDKTRFFSDIISNKVGPVYVYMDTNNNQLNLNVYNDQEGALREACINLHLLPSTTYGLLIRPENFVPGKSPGEYKMSDGYVVKKRVRMYKSINMERLADASNQWTSTPVYFSNFENAFNYCRYEFELRYSKLNGRN